MRTLVSGAICLPLAGLCVSKVWETPMQASWVYLAAFILVSAASLFYGWRLARTGPKPVTSSEKDIAQARHIGGRVLTYSAATPLLVGYSALSSTPGPNGIGMFDVLTWLGTLATLAVVISGAWVAVYVKRRDDERQHRLSIMGMRQRWIDELRTDTVEFLSLAKEVRQTDQVGEVDVEAAQRAFNAMEAVALRLNPVEAHHHMLITGMRGLLRVAGGFDQLRGRPSSVPPTPQTTFEVGVDWVRAMAQLVLKIEWVVTSHGAERVEEKVRTQWEDLRRYEEVYKGELLGIVPTLYVLRTRHNALTGGPDAEMRDFTSSTPASTQCSAAASETSSLSPQTGTGKSVPARASSKILCVVGGGLIATSSLILDRILRRTHRP